jgi:hypothetical protein
MMSFEAFNLLIQESYDVKRVDYKLGFRLGPDLTIPSWAGYEAVL